MRRFKFAMKQVQIGWATRDVSTDKPIVINGQAHLRVSRGVIDPVTTTALVLDDGEDCVIFVSLDMVSFRSQLLNELREKVRALCPEIPAEKIIANVTHAHTGPSHYTEAFNFTASDRPEDRCPVHMEIASSDEYRTWLSTTMAEMIAEAWNGRKPGGIAYGYGYAVVGHSRRVCYFDDVSKRSAANATDTFAVNGHAVMYGNTNDDNFSHYEAGADHFINLLYTFDAAGKLSGAIINVPCPSQNSEHEWKLTADYWHDVRQAIRAQYGDIFLLPQCAAAGDLSPRILPYKQAQDRRFRLKYGDFYAENGVERAARKDIAERIAAAFGEVLDWAQKDIRTAVPIRHKVSTVQLSRRMITDEEYQQAKEGLAAAQAQAFVETDDPVQDLITNSCIISNRKRFYTVLRSYEEQAHTKTHPMELHVLRVGDIAFATNRFELYMDFQHRMQARSPFEQTFIVQLCAQPTDNGGGYLCTQRAEEGRGYSAIIYSTTVSPEGGQELVNETLRQLNELKNMD